MMKIKRKQNGDIEVLISPPNHKKLNIYNDLFLKANGKLYSKTKNEIHGYFLGDVDYEFFKYSCKVNEDLIYENEEPFFTKLVNFFKGM